MAEPAFTPLTSQSNPSVTLASVTEPVKDDLKKFRSFFKDAVSSDVFLLDQILKYLWRQKGKEIRPTLVFMSARIFGPLNNRSYVAATMIELLHTATLIHDDVVDEAESRRGFLSINKIWRNKAGVLLGDFLLSKGLLIALDNKEYDLLHVLSEAVRNMSEGELRQLKTSKLFNMTEERYYQIISEKTASLIAACCKCGAVSTSDDPKIHQKMHDAGLNIGIAFQIKDDLFDYGIDDVGKPKRNDIKERKVTLPLIKAMEKADSRSVKDIRALMRKRNKTSDDVEEIVSFVNKYDGLKETEKAMNHYAEKAQNILRSLPHTGGLSEFEALIQYIITRKK